MGFFTNLPVEQIVEAVEDLISKFSQKQSLSIEEVKFTVQLQAPEPRLRVSRQLQTPQGQNRNNSAFRPDRHL